MIIADLNESEGRSFPARRTTWNVAGGLSPIKTENFSAGKVILEPKGGQVPWHDHDQEEVYFILQGKGEICLGEERREIVSGQAVYIPPKAFHQLTNRSEEPLVMIYIYGPAGDVAHWKQELDHTLPKAGEDAPPLPPDAAPQTL